MRIRNIFPDFKDEGEVIASWGEAKLIKHWDDKLELKGGSKEDAALSTISGSSVLFVLIAFTRSHLPQLGSTGLIIVSRPVHRIAPAIS